MTGLLISQPIYSHLKTMGAMQVQNSLAELGLVAVLNDMFDKLDWSVSQSRANSRGIHGLGCHCNPKSVGDSWDFPFLSKHSFLEFQT